MIVTGPRGALSSSGVGFVRAGACPMSYLPASGALCARNQGVARPALGSRAFRLGLSLSFSLEEASSQLLGVEILPHLVVVRHDRRGFLLGELSALRDIAAHVKGIGVVCVVQGFDEYFVIELLQVDEQALGDLGAGPG